jgi:hypothetical protein
MVRDPRAVAEAVVRLGWLSDHTEAALEDAHRLLGTTDGSMNAGTEYPPVVVVPSAMLARTLNSRASRNFRRC